MKNINNRIIIPCERITQVQDGVKDLKAQANKFDEYLSSITRKSSPKRKQIKESKDDNFRRSMVKPLHLVQNAPEYNREFGSLSP